MKKFSIVLIALGLALLIGGNVFYGQRENPDDSGGSKEISTLNGSWSVKIPAYMGGVMFLFGSIFYYIAAEDEKKEREALQHA